MKNNMCYLLVLILFALIAINAATWMGIDNGVSNQSIQLYNQTVAKYPWKVYPCNKPQPRVYVLSKLLRTQSESVDKPIYIICMRCDVHSGCCYGSTRTCVPDKSQIYYEKLQIHIFRAETNATTPEWFKVEQHGKCICEDSQLHPEQDQERQLPKITRSSSRE